jgi:hypothetical protein
MKQKTNGLEPFNVEEEQQIIRDCVEASYNIDNLTDKAYRFLKNSIGFIAHYDRLNFMRCYCEPGSLKQDILEFQYQNQRGGFRPGEPEYEYYMQQRNIYNTICDCLKHNVEYHPRPRRNARKTMEFDFGR